MYTVALAASRGFGTMVPTVLIDKVGRSLAQPLLAFVVIGAGWSSAALAIAWVSPMAAGLALTLFWVGSLLRRWEADPFDGPESAAGGRHTFREFWRFTAPRGLAGVFSVAILWVGTLLVGALSSSADAGVFAAATRYLAVGQFIGVAIIQVVGPKLSELLAAEDRDRARAVYATSTTWLMLAAWPLYLTMIIMAPALLSVFGPAYQQAQGVLAILGAAMLVATAVGPVDIVLLMAGKSSWNLFNTVVALIANIGLSLVLIPTLGINGAAIAWATSILLTNLLPLAQVRRLVRIHPFGRGSAVAGGIAIASFGLIELLIRSWLGSTIGSLILAGALATITAGALAWRFRGPLRLNAFRDVYRRSSARTERGAL
jgi:O-antigen/teichoic acid export membrane protein